MFFLGVHNFDQKGYKVHGLFVFEVVKDKQVKESSFQQELKECLLSILTVTHKIYFFLSGPPVSSFAFMKSLLMCEITRLN